MFVEHKEAGEVSEAPAKVLKLSDAIRVGAALRPQCTGDLFRSGRSCALGAAYEGATGEVCGHYDYGLVTKRFPILKGKGGDGSLNKLGTAIFDRNDSGMSRESIADWLEAQGY